MDKYSQKMYTSGMKIFKKNPLEKISSKLWLVGLIQALGICIYVVGISLFITYVSSLFYGKVTQPIAMSIVMLLILSVSALICGGISLGYPIFLVSQKRWGESIKVVLWTAGFMAIFILAAVGILFSTAKDQTLQYYPQF